MFKSNPAFSRGFTLIELLVVIAIIGILSSVVLASLNTARAKGRVASAQSTMKSVQVGATICVNMNAAINLPTDTTAGGGGALCTGNAATYSALPAGWIYCDGTAGTQAAGTNCGNEVSSQTTGTAFTLVAESAADNAVVTCTTDSCTTANTNAD